ncbi:MAG TPA: dihydropteroate synthase [Mycobacteriales bacterium]|nr:dihydropteroate synthase [Mycobacteriales bacterium]
MIGVVNVTPDSFSDGGRHLDPGAAVAHGIALHAAGADLVDVGGESTRPGATRVDATEEIRRVLPVVRDLVAAGVTVSIDTMRRETATAALVAGASIVNDVSGGLADPDLPRLVADHGVPYVLMHWRGHSDEMYKHAQYADVVGEVGAELTRRVEAVVAAGVELDQIVLDPGIGFAKTAEHNWTLVANLDRLAYLGRPLLVGASRKSFLGELLAVDDLPRPPEERDDATVATTVLAALAGAWAVRVHSVPANVDAVKVAARVLAARDRP